MDNQEVEILLLAPSRPINKISFLQCIKNIDGLHLEVGIDQKKSVKIVCKNHLSVPEVFEYMYNYYNEKPIDVRDWYDLQ